jgi:hypothetical protein
LKKSNQKTFAPECAGVFTWGAKVFCGAFLQKSDRLLSKNLKMKHFASISFGTNILITFY